MPSPQTNEETRETSRRASALRRQASRASANSCASSSQVLSSSVPDDAVWTRPSSGRPGATGSTRASRMSLVSTRPPPDANARCSQFLAGPSARPARAERAGHAWASLNPAHRGHQPPVSRGSIRHAGGITADSPVPPGSTWPPRPPGTTPSPGRHGRRAAPTAREPENALSCRSVSGSRTLGARRQRRPAAVPRRHPPPAPCPSPSSASPAAVQPSQHASRTQPSLQRQQHRMAVIVPLDEHAARAPARGESGQDAAAHAQTPPARPGPPTPPPGRPSPHPARTPPTHRLRVALGRVRPDHVAAGRPPGALPDHQASSRRGAHSQLDRALGVISPAKPLSSKASVTRQSRQRLDVRRGILGKQ